MGALHAGHMALVAEAKIAAPRVVVSIFVNPRQFGPNEDLARYPRREQADSRMLAEAGVDVLWMPPVEVMYPEGHATSVSVRGVSDPLDRSEEHTSELQSRRKLVCRLLLEKKKEKKTRWETRESTKRERNA